MKCPICKGKGELEIPAERMERGRKAMAIALLKEGFGIRETQRMVGYKSPKSVQDIDKALNDLKEGKISLSRRQECDQFADAGKEIEK